MDIEYLLVLQNLREAAPGWLNTLLSTASEFAVSSWVTLLPALIFWCISKEGGAFLMLGQGIARGANCLVKNTFCVYRPWIRDSRVESSLMNTATGYSFPSGHTTIATSFYGGIGMLLKKKTGRFFWIILFLIPAALTGFARNWVGAHTPQDVAVGFLLTLLLMVLCDRLLAWIRQKPERDAPITMIFCAISAAVLIYVAFKPYPLDYTAGGELLVDPVSMMRDAFGDVGMMCGAFVAWFAERRLIRFTTDDLSVSRRLSRGVVGIILGYLFQKAFLPAVGTVLTQPHAYKFVSSFLNMLFLMFLYPLIFHTAEKYRKSED